MKILIPGELNVDLVLQNPQSFPVLGRELLVEDLSLTLGSSSAICAAALAKLGDSVTFVSKVGCDSWGDLCVNSLEGFGVNCSLVTRDPLLKTGITVSITSAKDRAFLTYLGASAALKEGDVSDAVLQAQQHLHVSSFFLQQGLRPGLKSLLSRAHKLGLTTSLDTGFDPAETWGSDLIDVLQQVDFFLPNEVELAAITGTPDRVEALRSLQNGKTLTVAKLGGEGCMAIHRDQIVRVPAFPVIPVDTTGAGDTFNAGFLHALLLGENLRDAMIFGAAAGALSTLSLGGTTNQPTVERVREFIANCSQPETVS